MDFPELDQQRLWQVLAGLTCNPACPADVLRRLARSRVATELALLRPDISAALAEDLLSRNTPEITQSLATNPEIPLPIRRRLSTHPDPVVRSRAARHCDQAPDILERLANDPDPAVRKAVATQGTLTGLPAAVRTHLATDPAPEVRAAMAARWYDPPPDTHRRLLTDPTPSVRTAALSIHHPPPPADLHTELLTNPATTARALPHVTLTAAQATTLSTSPDMDIRAAMAEHPHLPPEPRQALAADPELYVQIAVLLSRWTPEDLRAHLYAELTDPTRNPAVVMLSKHYIGHAWKQRGWLQALPLNERLTYLDSPYPFFRRAAASAGELPHEVAIRLLEDPDIQVRQITARQCATIPGPTLEKLVLEHGDDPTVRPMLVEHPNFPPEAFQHLAKAENATARLLAPQDNNLPADLVIQLAKDPDPRVRHAAAGHPHLPATCLPALLTDDDLDVTKAAAKAPAFPITWMHQALDATT